ncbi:MAG TPA: amino acid permease [Bacteroidales bacterium]|nr:amino acid permease [Bacteroidales bacterium]
MAEKKIEHRRSGFGTAPVFFTAISTILGAILFLRYGYATGMLGFWGVVLIVGLGHLVTIPTAMAISELATNKRVEGGGEYFIISRSFGLNVGGTIGIALFLSQAISVAFYVIAFTEAFSFFFDWMKNTYDVDLPRQVISIPVMLGLSVLILRKGANLGVKALYFVVAILFISLAMFFLGSTDHAAGSDFSLVSAQFRNMDQFFLVFAIIFPAFTGMTAGVGLSGDLRKPSKSIPLGTLGGTILGLIVYFFITYKLALSASPADLIENQLIMSKIAIGGAFVIPIGLAASTISSALGSVMVAPRTLQALANDRSFPFKGMNRWIARGRVKDNEPVNASLLTCIIAMVFVAFGNVNAVAEIISMFFMVTYGALCLISFLNHFGSSPSYRPSFHSRWYISLLGFLVALWVMFKINTPYALMAIVMMLLIYFYINSYHRSRGGMQAILANALFQVNRNIQVYLQKAAARKPEKEWRPSAICISRDSFQRTTAFDFLNWLSYKYGFGTYLHLIEGYYSKATHKEAEIIVKDLLNKFDRVENHVYVDTIISPSYTSAIAQAIQIPGIAGMENNMVIFEFDKEEPENLLDIVDNFSLVNAGNFDVCIVGSANRSIRKKEEIHIWIRSGDTHNANLMIMIGFIIQYHPLWGKSNIRIFDVCKPEEREKVKANLDQLLQSGRLPITQKNVEIISEANGQHIKKLITEKSRDAGITIVGFREESLKHYGIDLFKGYESVGNMLFVNSFGEKPIE